LGSRCRYPTPHLMVEFRLLGAAPRLQFPFSGFSTPPPPVPGWPIRDARFAPNALETLYMSAVLVVPVQNPPVAERGRISGILEFPFFFCFPLFSFLHFPFSSQRQPAAPGCCGADEAFGYRSAPAGAECLVSGLTRHSATARPRRVPNASSRSYPPIPLPGSGQPPPDSIVRRGGGRGGGVNSTPSLSLRILWVLVKYLTSKVGSSYLPEMFRKGKKYKRIPAPWASAPLSPPQNSGDLVRHSSPTPSWTQRQGAAKLGEKQRKSRKSPQWHPSQIPQIPKER